MFQNLNRTMNSFGNQLDHSDPSVEIFAQTSSPPQDSRFDQIVGALEDIVMEKSFSQLQQTFIREHCPIFEEGEENKITYMPVFNSYQELIQKYIIEKLIAHVPSFSMNEFSELLSTRTDQIDEDLLEMLNSFTDFLAFKEMMLEHKLYYQQEEAFGALSIRGTSSRSGE